MNEKAVKLIWPFPSSFGSIWRLSSRFTIAAVGLIGRFILSFLNKTQVVNRERLLDAIDDRPAHVPLLTVANHASCFDDPGLWGGILDVRHFHPDVIRWSLTAHDVCFTNALHSQFFARGNCVPVVRGAGVYQRGLDFCVDLLNRGRWVHIFPEGKVNAEQKPMRFKWGVGRLVSEARVTPIVLPMWHCGMDRVLPNREPYRFKWGNRVLLNVGRPVDLAKLMSQPAYLRADDRGRRQLITDRIQHELMALKEQTERLYADLCSDA